MAEIRDELILDISQALREVNELERALDRALTETALSLDTTRANQQLNALDAETIHIDVDSAELDQTVRSADRLERELEEVDRQADRTSTSLARVGTRGTATFNRLRDSLQGAAVGFAAFFGARAFIGFAGDAIQAASDLAESTSKVNVVFGDFAGEIETFASTAPQALGLANQAALEFTGTFGNLFVALGLSQEAAADLAPDIVQLGSDLASFNNLEVTDALDKLRAGLVGEAEPLRALGVNLTEASVQAKAAELGFVGLNNELTEAEKVQARYALIVEQTATAQGDFARTADGTANKVRTLKAEFADVQAQIGVALIGTFDSLIDAAQRVIPDITAMGESIATMAGKAEAAEDPLFNLIDIVAGIPRGFGVVGDVVGGLGDALLSPFQALGSLLVGFDVEGAKDQFLDIGQSLEGMFDSLQQRAILESFIGDLKQGVDPALAFANAAAATARENNLTAESFQGLARISGETPERLIQATRELLRVADASGFTADEVQVLNDELIRLRRAQFGAEDIDFFGGESVQDARFFAGAVREVASAFTTLEGEIALVDPARLEGVFADFEAELAGLPNAMDAAADALRTKEGEIITDFSVFLADLDGELQARAVFTSNLAILRAFGLDTLADVFEAEGLAAAGALADAVANPTEAREAESKLVGFANDQATAYRGVFLDLLGDLELTAAERILAIRVAFNVDEFPTFNAGEIVLPGQVVTQSGGGGGGTVVNNNFYTQPEPTTATQRITQTVASITRS